MDYLKVQSLTRLNHTEKTGSTLPDFCSGICVKQFNSMPPGKLLLKRQARLKVIVLTACTTRAVEQHRKSRSRRIAFHQKI